VNVLYLVHQLPYVYVHLYLYLFLTHHAFFVRK
jgi:hypothetical protein